MSPRPQATHSDREPAGTPERGGERPPDTKAPKGSNWLVRRRPAVWAASALAAGVASLVAVRGVQTSAPTVPEYVLVMPASEPAAGAAAVADSVAGVPAVPRFTAGRRLQFELRTTTPADVPVQVVVFGSGPPSAPLVELYLESEIASGDGITVSFQTGSEGYVPPRGSAELIFLVGLSQLPRPTVEQVAADRVPTGFRRYRQPVVWLAPEQP